MDTTEETMIGPRPGGTDVRAEFETRLALAEAAFADYGARLGSGPDALGDYLKGLERGETRRVIPRGEPFCVRLDGKTFSSFTRPLARPYDERMSRAMVEVTRELVRETGAVMGYTQSDEITLGFAYADERSEAYLGAKVQKLCSVPAGRSSSLFLVQALGAFPEAVARQVPSFDGRAFGTGDLETLAMCFVWRELDAARNAVSMAARAHFPHSRLQDRSCRAMESMLLEEKGVRFEDYPTFFRRGTYLRRVSESRVLTAAELERIPLAKRPKGPVIRSRVAELAMPSVMELANPVAALLGGAEPVAKEERKACA